MTIELPPERCWSLAASARVARLGTRRRDGRVDLVPITFALAESRLYTVVDAKPKRSARLQRLVNVESFPEVTVLFDHYEDDWSALWWVRLRGVARVVAAGADRDTALAHLLSKYDQYREQSPEGPAIVIEAREWRGWSGG